MNDYHTQVAEIITVITDDPTRAMELYPSADSLAEYLTPDQPENRKVFDVLAKPETKYLRINPTKLERALEKRKSFLNREIKRLEKEEFKKQVEATRLAEIEAALDGVPTDEESFVRLVWSKHGYTMLYDRRFFNADNKLVRVEEIHNDIHLTAAHLNLVKPRGDMLGGTNLDRALSKLVFEQKENRLDRVKELVRALPDNVQRTDVLETFDAITQVMFEEPEYASAAFREFVWQVKRKMFGLPINQVHLFLLVGPQNGGKTEFVRMLLSAISEVAAECSLADAMDTRQIDLLEFFVLNIDEMVAADRADINAIKNFVTGVSSARRPMRTNIAEKITINATIVGTSNHPLGNLVFDNTGMRRFVEVRVKTDRKQIEPYWSDIVRFDWLALWQAVDHTAESPLMTEFKDTLQKKQEEARNPSNTELWLKAFDPYFADGDSVKCQNEKETEYYAAELYMLFRQWEEIYDRGFRGTSLTRWGRDFKALVDRGEASQWTYSSTANKTVYVMQTPINPTEQAWRDKMKAHQTSL